MTRDEQIENAARHYSIKASEDVWDRPNWEDIEWAFEVGAKWADEHPNWHKYSEEKPSRTDEYVVAFDNGNVYTAHYIQHRDKWHDNDIANNCNTSNVIAWMEFPKPHKFD